MVFRTQKLRRFMHTDETLELDEATEHEEETDPEDSGDPTYFADLKNYPTQKRSKKTVEEIISAAEFVLRTIGRDTFTTENVSEMAGISVGTLYRYFYDRTHILDVVWPDRKDVFLPPENEENEEEPEEIELDNSTE